MTTRAFIDNESEFALWTRRSATKAHLKPRVLIAHRDKAIGESLVLLLSMKGYDALYAADLPHLKCYLNHWEPQAILFDTRFDAATDYRFTRSLRDDPAHADVLMLAMSNIWPSDPIGQMKDAGFDGHCRRPCSLWRVADILEGYFAPR